MRKLFIIGIGAGDPEHLTMQAIRALNRVDVFFAMDKGAEKAALIDLRRAICERTIEGHAYRFVAVPDPVRDPAAESYRAGVETWHRQRADILQRLIADELAEDGCGAFLVWGDPSLYDSTLRIVDHMLANGTVGFEHEVIPGISSVQMLAARHRIALNHVGGPVRITTGRRLPDEWTPDADNVVVMLDGAEAFARIAPAGTTIYWGAYLGTAHEMLIAGPLATMAPAITRARAEARARHGWIMDTYLLRRQAAT
jgi:precorrin-6A synthase